MTKEHGDMIIDRALRQWDPDSIITEDARKYITALRVPAQRFYFSDNASELLGRFVFECSDLIMRAWPMAKAPYPVTYIEFDADSFFKHAPNRSPDGNTTARLGYLIDRGFTTNFVMNKDGENFICPLAFATEGTLPVDLVKTAGVLQLKVTTTRPEDTAYKDELLAVHGSEERAAEWMTLVTGLGSAIGHLDDENNRQALLKHMPIIVMADKEYWDSQRDATEGHVGLMKQQTGDVRNVWAAFLWLAQQATTTITQKPAGHRISSGKIHAYPKYRVVEINLGKRVRSVRRAFEEHGPRLPPRLHDVRGHWRHWDGDEAHTHEWSMFPDPRGHFTCKCGRQKVWVHDHERGDRTKEKIVKDYIATV